MLIRSQDRKTLVILETVGQIYVDASVVGHAVPHVYCDFPDGRSAKLGKYKDENRCIKVIESIYKEYQYLKEYETGRVGVIQPAFAFDMPEE